MKREPDEGVGLFKIFGKARLRRLSDGDAPSPNADSVIAPASPPDYPYRAFISYSRRDAAFVDRLYKRLAKFRTPPTLLSREGQYGAPPRALRIYLDRKSESAGGALDSRLRDKLEQSAFLIVICSQASADADSWMNKEVEHFLKISAPDRIIPVLLRKDRRQALTEILPPKLLELGDAAPVGADLLLDGGLIPVVQKLIGGLIGFNQDDIADEQEKDDRRRLRRVRFAAATLFVLAVAAIWGGYAAFRQSNAAYETRARFLAERAHEAADDGRNFEQAMIALESAQYSQGAIFRRPLFAGVRASLASWRRNYARNVDLADLDGHLDSLFFTSDSQSLLIDRWSGDISDISTDKYRTLVDLSGAAHEQRELKAEGSLVGGDKYLVSGNNGYELHDIYSGALIERVEWPDAPDMFMPIVASSKDGNVHIIEEAHHPGDTIYHVLRFGRSPGVYELFRVESSYNLPTFEFSDSGDRVLYADSSGDISIFDALGLRRLTTLKFDYGAQEPPIVFSRSNYDLSADGRYFVYGRETSGVESSSGALTLKISRNGAAVIDIDRGKIITTTHFGSDSTISTFTNDVSFIGEGNRTISCYDSECIAFSGKSGEWKHAFYTSDGVTALASDPKGEALAVVESFKDVEFVSTADWRKGKKIEAASANVKFSPDGSKAALYDNGDSASVSVLYVEDALRDVVSSYDIKGGFSKIKVSAMSAALDRMIMTREYPQDTVLTDLKGDVVATLETGLAVIEAAAFSQDGRYGFILKNNHEGELFDAHTGAPLSTMNFDDIPPALGDYQSRDFDYQAGYAVFTPDGEHVITYGTPAGADRRKSTDLKDSGQIGVAWRTDTGAVDYVFYQDDATPFWSQSQVLKFQIRHLRLLKGGRALTTNCQGEIALWDVADGRKIKAITRPRHGAISAISLNEDQTRLAIATSQGFLELWDLDSGALIASNKTQINAFLDVLYLPGGVIAATDSTYNMTLWSAADLSLIRKADISSKYMMLSPGKNVIVAGYHTALFDATTFEKLFDIGVDETDFWNFDQNSGDFYTLDFDRGLAHRVLSPDDLYKDQIKTACAAVGKEAKLSAGAAARYYLPANKYGPCDRYGLLHYKYYVRVWCNAVGYGCSAGDGWLKRALSKAEAREN